MPYHCAKCGIKLDEHEAYEYRGQFACEAHFDDVIAARDAERNGIIKEEDDKTKPLKGFDLSNSPIGRANQSILQHKIKRAKTESDRLRKYERPTAKPDSQ